MTSGRAANDVPTTADRVRQVGVTLAECFCVLGTLVGTGVLGTRVAESAGGSLSDQATLVAPSGPAFSIWSVIYVGLAAATILQWLPQHAVSARQRALGWWLAASMVLNATWLLVTQQGWIGLSVVVIVMLLAVLVVAVAECRRHPEPGWPNRLLIDGTLGLYLGWVAAATVANVAAYVSSLDLSVSRNVQVGAAVAGVVIAAVVSIALAWRLGGRPIVVVATAWALAWIAVGRLTDEPESTVVGVVAAVACAAVVLAALAMAMRATTDHRAGGRAAADIG